MGAPNCQMVSSATDRMAQPGLLIQPPMSMPIPESRLSTEPPSLKIARQTRAMDIDAPSSEGA